MAVTRAQWAEMRGQPQRQPPALRGRVREIAWWLVQRGVPQAKMHAPEWDATLRQLYGRRGNWSVLERIVSHPDATPEVLESIKAEGVNTPEGAMAVLQGTPPEWVVAWESGPEES